jgi:hypothetical protein
MQRRNQLRACRYGHTKASVMKARISLRTPLAFAHDQQNAIHCQRETATVIIEKTD